MSDIAIHTDALGRRYGRRWVVESVDLSVPQGSVYGFLGLNGAGKSTTIRMLMGLIRRDSGAATVLGLDPATDGVEVKRRVGYVAEHPAFYEWMVVEEICAFVANYRRDKWNEKRAGELLERFRLPRMTRLRELSKGQRAKVALVLALAHDPDLLLLDEPTTGLDPVARREFAEGVVAEYQREGKTIFISSHLVNEIAGLVDCIGIIHEGRLLHTSTTEAFLQSVQRVRMTFPDGAPRDVDCPGKLRYKADGREAIVAVQDFSDDTTLPPLRELHPENLEVERLTLEDAFVEVVGAAEGGVR